MLEPETDLHSHASTDCFFILESHRAFTMLKDGRGARIFSVAADVLRLGPHLAQKNLIIFLLH